jgi:putative hydrolase of the HAD superfamily
MLDTARIKAIALDLDDTLWPIWPTIRRAEQALHDWLTRHAPRTAATFGDAEALRAIREQVGALRPDLRTNLSAMRRESIRLALSHSGDDTALAEPAFDVFFAERQRVDFFDDALPALSRLAARYPLVSLSNGNADLQRVGLADYFRAAVSAQSAGVAKPDARIFHAAAAAVGVQAHEVLHVGDDAHLDVVGAVGCGMQAVWVNRDGHDWHARLAAQGAAHHADATPHLTVQTLSQLCDRVLNPRCGL